MPGSAGTGAEDSDGKRISMAENVNLPTTTVYKPSEILGIFQNFLAKVSAGTQVVFLRGIFLKKQQNSSWSFCYDVLRDEDTQEELTLRLTQAQRDELKDGSMIQVGGVIDKKLRPNGTIQIVLNVSRVETVQEQAISEEEIRMAEIRRTKSQKGFKNVDAVLEEILYRGERPKVALLFASTSITMADFDAGKEAASSHIDFEEHRASFGRPEEVCAKLRYLDDDGYDVIAMVRGGGVGQDALNDLGILETVAQLKTPLICAIGHVEEKLFLKNIADKVALTPNGLGSYFKDMVETVMEKRNRSKAILVEEVKKQFQKQLETAEKQNKELQERLTKFNKAQEEQTKQLKEMREASERQTKEFNGNLARMQKEVTEQRAQFVKLTNEHNRTVKDLAEAIAKSRVAIGKAQEEAEEKVRSLRIAVGIVTAIALILFFALLS